MLPDNTAACCTLEVPMQSCQNLVINLLQAASHAKQRPMSLGIGPLDVERPAWAKHADVLPVNQTRTCWLGLRLASGPQTASATQGGHVQVTTALPTIHSRAAREEQSTCTVAVPGANTPPRSAMALFAQFNSREIKGKTAPQLQPLQKMLGEGYSPDAMSRIPCSGRLGSEMACWVVVEVTRGSSPAAISGAAGAAQERGAAVKARCTHDDAAENWRAHDTS